MLGGFEEGASLSQLRALPGAASATLLDIANDPAAPLFVRARAVYGLRAFTAPGVAPTVQSALRAVALSAGADPLLRRAALDALAEGHGDLGAARTLLGGADPSMREAAGWTLSRSADPSARPALSAQLQRERDPAVARSLRDALGVPTPTAPTVTPPGAVTR